MAEYNIVSPGYIHEKFQSSLCRLGLYHRWDWRCFHGEHIQGKKQNIVKVKK